MRKYEADKKSFYEILAMPFVAIAGMAFVGTIVR